MAQKRAKQRAPSFSAKQLAAFSPNERYLIGVSGGRDSVALLHWLLNLGYRRLIVCHLDHRLRGRSSIADARFVARLAKANELPFELGTEDVRKIAAATKQSVETAARSARYSFFARVARRRRCRTIWLGHHADDLVETFLINLFRGAGTEGRRSMRSVSVRQVDKTQLTIVRPLLGLTRSAVDDYVKFHGLRFREDASNQDLGPLRNRMRLRIIPLLEREFGREIRTTVRRAAAIAAEEDALLEEMLPQPSPTGILSAKQLRALPVALQRRTIARWLRAHPIRDLGFDMVEQVRALLDVGAGPAKINLTGDRHARRRAGELFIE